jgi:hypothetical protein
MSNEPPPKDKIIVAVHGVGDQVLSETVQKVINRFCHYHDEKMGVPLGKIKTLSVEKNPYEQKNPSGQEKTSDEQKNPSGQEKTSDCLCRPFKMSKLGYEGGLGKLSFVEVHWADLARKVDENRFMLEKPKSWSETIIERLPKRYPDAAELSPKEFGRLRLLLREMLETIKTLENLFKVSALAGLFKFDLAGVLDAYLGDVQIVTEFDDVRREILDRFKTTMEKLPRDADIYIIAHSEGTVVTLLSLLEEMAGAAPPWLNQVRGVMTIGSPLDKHLLLWRELFEPHGEPLRQSWVPKDPERKIQWRNYYDHGDPIGFELEGIRDWLREHNWTAFNFRGTEDLGENKKDKADKGFYGSCRDYVEKKLAKPIHDFGFSRYYFPGKAHNDYWGDSQVFNHFIQTVVYKEEIKNAVGKVKDQFLPVERRLGKKHSDDAGSNSKMKKLDPFNPPPPPSKTLARLSSYCAPYLLLMALMFTGVFVLYKAVKVSVASDGLEALRYGLSDNQKEALKGFFPLLKGVYLENEVNAIGDFVNKRKNEAAANGFSEQSKKALRNALKEYPDKDNPSLPPGAPAAVIGATKERNRDLFRNVLGIAFLLAGMTALARIPRMALNPKWLSLSVVIFGIGAAGYWLFVLEDERAYLGRGLYGASNWLGDQIHPFLNVGTTWGLVILAAVLAIGSLVAEYIFPKWGLRMLLIFGGLGVVGIIAPNIFGANDRGPLWPVVLATAFSLYLWQVVALTFDLVFVWHRYIRHWRELGFSKWKPRREPAS